MGQSARYRLPKQNLKQSILTKYPIQQQQRLQSQLVASTTPLSQHIHESHQPHSPWHLQAYTATPISNCGHKSLSAPAAMWMRCCWTRSCRTKLSPATSNFTQIKLTIWGGAQSVSAPLHTYHMWWLIMWYVIQRLTVYLFLAYNLTSTYSVWKFSLGAYHQRGLKGY